MEERRLLLAVALSLLVLTAYQLLFPPKPPPPVRDPAAASPRPRAPPPATAAAPAAGRAGARAARRRRRPRSPPSPTTRSGGSRWTPPGVALVFTNKGARLLSWQLLEFKDRRGRPEEMVRMVPDGPRPLDLETGDPTLDARLRTALFRPSAERVAAAAGRRRDAALRVRRRRPRGQQDPHRPAGHGPRRGEGLGAPRGERAFPCACVWGPGLGTPTAGGDGGPGLPAAAGRLRRPGGRRAHRRPRTSGPAGPSPSAWWAGVESTHFAALFVPPGRARRAAEFRTAKVPAEEGAGVAPVAAVALAGRRRRRPALRRAQGPRAALPGRPPPGGRGPGRDLDRPHRGAPHRRS